MSSEQEDLGPAVTVDASGDHVEETNELKSTANDNQEASAEDDKLLEENAMETAAEYKDIDSNADGKILVGNFEEQITQQDEDGIANAEGDRKEIEEAMEVEDVEGEDSKCDDQPEADNIGFSTRDVEMEPEQKTEDETQQPGTAEPEIAEPVPEEKQEVEEQDKYLTEAVEPDVLPESDELAQNAEVMEGDEVVNKDLDQQVQESRPEAEYDEHEGDDTSKVSGEMSEDFQVAVNESESRPEAENVEEGEDLDNDDLDLNEELSEQLLEDEEKSNENVEKNEMGINAVVADEKIENEAQLKLEGHDRAERDDSEERVGENPEADIEQMEDALLDTAENNEAEAAEGELTQDSQPEDLPETAEGTAKEPTEADVDFTVAQVDESQDIDAQAEYLVETEPEAEASKAGENETAEQVELGEELEQTENDEVQEAQGGDKGQPGADGRDEPEESGDQGREASHEAGDAEEDTEADKAAPGEREEPESEQMEVTAEDDTQVEDTANTEQPDEEPSVEPQQVEGRTESADAPDEQAEAIDDVLISENMENDEIEVKNVNSDENGASELSVGTEKSDEKVNEKSEASNDAPEAQKDLNDKETEEETQGSFIEVGETASNVPEAMETSSAALNKLDNTTEQSAAVNQVEVALNQSTALDQAENASNQLVVEDQTEDASSKNDQPVSIHFSSVNVKKEKMDEDKQTEGAGLKIVGVTSAVGLEEKDNQSTKESDKGDKSAEKSVESEKMEATVTHKNDMLTVKQEKLASANQKPETALKRGAKEEANKKIKDEATATEEEDDDVIAIKEEKKPVAKPKSKIQKCIVCEKVGKCKYNIVRNGDVKHLCDDNCFKRFRSNPTQYLRHAETSSDQNAANKADKPQAPVKPVSRETASEKLAAAKANEKLVQQQSPVYKTCSVCQLMNVRTSKPFLNWQGRDYCGEECLGKFQAGLSSNCSYCQSSIFQNNKTKYCCTVGNEVKHFCSLICNTEFSKRIKLCAFCNNDLSMKKDSFMAPVGDNALFKDFCSQTCLQSFEAKNKKDLELVGIQKGQTVPGAAVGTSSCTVCGKMSQIKHEFKLDSKLYRLCSDPCFSAFKYANKITMNNCDNCNACLFGDASSYQCVQFEGQQKRFCSFLCVNTFRGSNKKIVACAWCCAKKTNFDMIERVDANNKYQLFCSLNCLSLYRVNLQATSNQAVVCDQCRKFVPAQYHLTMSDASVRNFCSYGCVMQFQAQFQAPAKQAVGQQQQVVQVESAAAVAAAAAGGGKQQTVTRSGRVVNQKGSKSSQTPASRNNGGKVVVNKNNSPDSFPIISNVVSLAAQGKQQEINIKTSTPVSVNSQQIPGIKTNTTYSGTQVVQQQIIIQPPLPKSMKNKSLLCKPITQTKATSCRPHTQTKETQTEKGAPEKALIPVPVPIYCPTPLFKYAMPTPIFVPIPVPIPVPIFIPTTKKSANSILKQIKDIREKIPADPLEAELLMMADMVAGKEEMRSSSSEDEEEEVEPPEPVKPVKETPATPAPSSGDLGEDMLQMALRMASEMSDEPAMDLENTLEPVTVNTAPPPPSQPQPVLSEEPHEEEEEYIPTSARNRRSRGGGSKRLSRSTPRRNPKRQKVETPPQYKEPTPTPSPQPAAPPPDANFHLKYTYGVNAFKHWVLLKNTQFEQASKPGQGKALKTFKSDILQCTADELNFSLCLFVKEVRKPNGEEYAVDSIFYLCLGIQQYMYENGRIDNIFGDIWYDGFTEALNAILTKYEPRLNHSGQLVCRIEEEHLWESKQLGAHSPHVLLNSLVYFNTKFFMLKTSEEHLRLSFTHIMKHWKKTPSGRGSGTGANSGRSVYLRYYCPTPQGKDLQQKRKKEEMPVYEQTENLDNPLRCPVKLYEFYLSKCPESIKNRNDTFYLVPERSCVPDSPVWYSTATLGIDHMAKMLNRIRLVREIQEAHLHTQPIFV
ncbi:zinc finger MYM-type protein 4-like isoform X2 [Mya arenaria]|uniref:zinc finger MYM-type protein 4-like isoform X2 n=2 Tax=Mya arenaria TaxID=6604 RepID=UPI0022E480CF|nr:zinc finger MYM-type protein 4-like isoform X2 [Mya arenaria]